MRKSRLSWKTSFGTKPRIRRGTFWAYSYTSYNQSSITPESRILIGDYDRCVSIGGAGGSNACKRGWGSGHSGGLNFALCDASVKNINESVNMNLLANMATIAGQEAQVVTD